MAKTKSKNGLPGVLTPAMMAAAAGSAQLVQTLFYADKSLGLPGNAQTPDEELMTLKAAIDTWDNSAFATIAHIQREMVVGMTGWQITGHR
jgi:hypothetical protein